MKVLIFKVLFCLLFMVSSHAGVGINAGIGFPFVSQYGLNLTLGDKLTLGLGYNNLSLESGEASVDLTMPEAILYWHPFGGSFFIGGGIGKETLTVEAKDDTTGASVKAEVDANTTIAKLGWMWGKANGGFWFGMDIAYISPSGGDTDVTTTGVPDSEDVDDVEEAGEKFGETAYTNITFARFGYIF